MRWMFLVLLLVVMAASAQAADILKTPNLAYGQEPAQKYDVYAPKVAVNAPVIVFVHGGGWAIGDKANARAVNNKMQHWVDQGAIFISVNYRMLPAADPYVQAQDVALAIKDIQSRAKTWGGDITKMVITGHSAGAHLLMLVQSDAALMKDIKPWAATVALDSGAYNVTTIMHSGHRALFDNAFGTDPEFWARVSPTSALAGAIPPSLLICSSKRRESCPFAQEYARKAQGLGNSVDVEEENLTHEQINETLGLSSSYTNDVDRFLRQQKVF